MNQPGAVKRPFCRFERLIFLIPPLGTLSEDIFSVAMFLTQLSQSYLSLPCLLVRSARYCVSQLTKLR